MLAVSFMMIHRNFIPDDAYITYRYARNLSLGRGFVYNPGEHVLGTTTPLYTLLLAAIAYLTHIEISNISLLIGAISLWVSAGLLFNLGVEQDWKFATTSAVIYLTNPFLSRFVGMESLFLLAMFLLTNYAYLRRKLLLTALLGGLITLVRYEMLFFVLLIGLTEWITQRKAPLWLWPSIVPILLWGIYSFFYFGSPVPLSASAKLIAPRIPFLVGGAVLWYSFMTESPLIFIAVVFSLIGVFGWVVTRKINPRYTLLLSFSVLYIGLAAFLAGSFPWYYAPLTFIYAISITYGIDSVGLFMKLIMEKKAITRYIVQYGCLALIVVAQLSFWWNAYRTFQDQQFDTRYAAYKDIADWLNEHAAPTDRIATFEIGYIGYFTDMKIVDLAGLVTPSLYLWVDDGAEQSLYHSLRLSSPEWVLIPAHNQQQRDIMTNDKRYVLQQVFDDRFLLYERQ